MRCQKIEKWISDFIDDELSEKKKKILKDHVQICRRCRAYQSNLQKLREEVHALEARETAPQSLLDFSSRLRTGLESWEQRKRKDTAVSPVWKWRWERGWDWKYAAVGLAVTFLILMFILLPQRTSQYESKFYVFTIEDVLTQVFSEIGDNPELENSYNSIILRSLENELDVLGYIQTADPYDYPLIWEELTEEELKFIESEIKKEMKS
jgi:hypothetical protein